MRIRTLKPDLWFDEAFGKVDREARLLFVGLISQSDDHGKQKASPVLLRARLCPYDKELSEDQIEGWLDQLSDAKLIIRYAVDDSEYVLLPTWHRHQKVPRPAPSVHPDPPARKFMKIHEDSRRFNAEERKKEIGKERNGTEEIPPSSDKPDEREIFEAWKKAAGRTNKTVFTAKRRRLIQVALSSYPAKDVLDAVHGWRNSPHHRGENAQGVVFNNLELLLRDAEHIEKFRDLARNGNSHQMTSVEMARRLKEARAK